MQRSFRIVAAALATLVASACGHSGSGSSPPLLPSVAESERSAAFNPAVHTPRIQEFPIPGGGSPAGITAVNQSAVWFVNEHKIGRFDTTTHRIIQYNSLYDLGPDITPGSDFALWTTGNLPGGINDLGLKGNYSEVVRLTQSGSWSHRVLPQGGAPYGGSAITVTHGLLDDVWYAMCGGCRVDESDYSNFGSVSPSFVFANPGAIQFVQTYYYEIRSMSRGSDGNLWISGDGGDIAAGTIPAAIFRVVPGAPQENAHWFFPNFDTPPFTSFAGNLNPGPNALVWFTDPQGNAIGKISTEDTLIEYPVPTANAWPWKITLNGDGLLYFTENMANKIGRIDPSTGHISEFSLPLANAEPYGIIGTVSKKVYFTYGADIGMLTP